MVNKDLLVKEINELKQIVRAQATMIIAYRIGKLPLPEWVFDTLIDAKKKYGENLSKIK